MLIAMSVAAALAGASDVAATPATTPPPRVLAPKTVMWLRPSAPPRIADYYPREAMKRNVEGQAVVSCTVTERGGLTDCSVISETPPGYGFGQATIRAVAEFRMAPQTTEGVPVDGATVNITMRWQLPPKQ
jgi:protein TonB